MFKTKSFIPYLLVVFLNSFVDLGHKILIQNTLYQTTSPGNYTILSSILNALILLPYILIFTPSGFISDHFSKVKVLRVTAILAVPILLFITYCYYEGWFWMAFALTLTLGFQSAVNSPAKYGYIKEIFGKSNIAQANAYVQTTAIVAILGGTVLFTVLFTYFVDQVSAHVITQSDTLKAFAPLGFVLVLFSLLEVVATRYLSQKRAADPRSEYQAKLYFRGYYLRQYLSEITRSQVILISIIGLALFWAVNQVLLASYGAYLKTYVMDATPLFAQGSLAIGGLGILLGALYAGRVSKGFIETGLIPVGAIGLTFGILLLAHLTSKLGIVSVFLVYGFFGGMFVVPLNALIQFNAKSSQLGKVLAGNNFIQNIFMFLFLVLSSVGALLGETSKMNFHVLFFLMLAGSIATIILLPQSLIRYLLYFTISKLYRIEVIGLNNIPSSGGVLLLGNHTSFLDWAIIQISCPRSIRFVMERSIYEKWYLNWLLSRLRMIPISAGASKTALEIIQTALNQGEIVALFPEGCLSRNGQLGEFHAGFERAAAGTHAKIIPFYLRGLWGTLSSYATSYYKMLSKVKHRQVSITFGKPLSSESSTAQVKQAVTHLSVQSWRHYAKKLGTIPDEWLKRAKQMGNTVAAYDSTVGSFTHYKLIALVFHLRKVLRAIVGKQKNAGILLPTSVGGIATNLAMLLLGRAVVNLNYTAGDKNVKFAIERANLSTVITSQKFLEKLTQKGFDFTEVLSSLKVVFIEDLVAGTHQLSILKTLLIIKILPLPLIKLFFIEKNNPYKPAAILFSSGSEGNPKGVMLSHQNILSNIKQIVSVFNIEEGDVVLSCLPLFHAFGLTVTSLMPIIEGIPVVCHPDPTDAKTIGRLIFQYNVSVLCSTSSILGLYNRNEKLLAPMLKSVRFVIAGAEKLSSKVYDEFKKKFNIDIYEGYGATELSPVASTNLPDILNSIDWRIHKGTQLGTVGLPLPGTAFKIVDPDTWTEMPLGEAGMILVSGPQVMLGYIDDDRKAQEVLSRENGIIWYKTGDKGYLNEAGFLTIVDRYSRFAKIGGEMVSLSALEQQILAAIHQENTDVMAIAVQDEKKGEKIILLYNVEMESAMLKKVLQEAGIQNIMLPAEYLYVKELPKLGSGKKDYVRAREIWMAALGLPRD